MPKPVKPYQQISVSLYFIKAIVDIVTQNTKLNTCTIIKAFWLALYSSNNVYFFHINPTPDFCFFDDILIIDIRKLWQYFIFTNYFVFCDCWFNFSASRNSSSSLCNFFFFLRKKNTKQISTTQAKIKGMTPIHQICGIEEKTQIAIAVIIKMKIGHAIKVDLTRFL